MKTAEEVNEQIKKLNKALQKATKEEATYFKVQISVLEWVLERNGVY